jgi:very-short-patch-repair endonuclease
MGDEAVRGKEHQSHSDGRTTGPTALTEKGIEELRRRLLDLSLNNQLLNFRPSEKSKRHIRLVDEVPSVLIERLRKGSRLVFEPVPMPDIEPEDERTPEFQEALRKAKTSDEKWLQEKADLGPRPRRKDLNALERALRDRCRGALGMAPWRAIRSAKEHAETLGISTTYELPQAPEKEKGGRHTDDRLQTLFFPDELDTKLAGIYSAATSLEKDAGIHALYVAFGFLEWYEARDSTVPLYAPLLLWPVGVTKDLVNQHYEYGISGRDEDEAVNQSLIEKLKVDFGLVLPEVERFEDEETGAIDIPGWFAAVGKTASKKDPRWMVRNWAIVGLMTFHKIAIWEDLDPSKWPRNSDPRNNPILKDIFDGGEPWDGNPASDHDIDAVELDEGAPLLITEADSSQHSAVIDVMRGKNLVIQGPPGTGKSQTITNIIAAALHKGKSVLFVSEKMAALEVVKSRLDDAGLGDFCLELHSDKASRSAVLSSLRARLELKKPPYKTDDIAGLRRKLDNHKKGLTSYVEKMNAKVGETGKTVHDIIWGHARTKEVLEKGPAGLKTARIADPLTLGSHDRAELKRVAEALDDATAFLGEDAKPSRQPWRGIGRTDFTMFNAKEAADMALKAAQAARKAKSEIALAATDAGWEDVPDSLAWLRKRLMGAPDSSEFLPDEKVAPALKGLLTVEARAAVGRLSEALERRSLALAELAAFGEAEKMIAAGEEVLAEARAAVGRLDLGAMTPRALRVEAKAIEEAATLIDAAIAEARKLRTLIGSNALLTTDGISMFLAALECGFPEIEVRDLVRDELGREGARVQLERAKDFARNVAKAFSAIGDGAVADGIAGPSTLREAAGKLRSTGFLGRAFSGDYKRAKETFRRILPERRKARREEMARALDAAVEWRSSLEDFNALVSSNVVLTAVVQNVKAPFDRLIGVARWMEEIKRATPATNEGSLELRRAILAADEDRIQIFLAFAAKHGAVLKSLLNGAPGPLEDAAQKMRARRDELKRLVPVVEKIGWWETQPLGSLGAGTRFVTSVIEHTKTIDEAGETQRAVGVLWSGYDTDPRLLRGAIGAAERMANWPVSREALQRVCESGNPIASARALMERFKAASEAATAAALAMAELQALMVLSLPVWCNAPDCERASFANFAARCEHAAAWPELLPRQCSLLTLENQARDAGLGAILDAWLRDDLAFSSLDRVVDAVWLRSAAEEIVRSDPTLSSHLGHAHESVRRSYQQLDRQWLDLNREELAAKLARNPIPVGSRSGPRGTWTGLELIFHQCSLDRPSMHLRRLFAQGGDAIRAVKPCLMMSPMSVARYLVAGQHKFDLVVIDEASQMRPEDAAGSVLRAGQVVIVGDPMQLPPTSFFTAQGGAEEFDEEAQEVVEDSILELSMRAWKPVRTLKWHYRSRHQSLIAYSNSSFYDGNLIVFPSDRDRGPNAGVRLERVKGVYANGKNEIEAKAAVEAARAFMYEHPGKSLGIVAMNQRQQELISSLMDELYAQDPEAESYRRYWAGKLESAFVKNLENVQGDERDAILISTVYGPDERGAFAMRFGPINLANGHRRLNVLFTRAKEMMTVFTSMDPAQIKLAAGTHRGVKVLKEYLDYADTGYVPESPDIHAGRGPETEFEHWFVERLRGRGYEAIPQVGVKGYRIDIGVRHPDKPGRFILGVECDGASYHSAKATRDRDRLRQTVLERLGWTIYRIWSTDWFRDPEAEFETLVRKIERLRAAS